MSSGHLVFAPPKHGSVGLDQLFHYSIPGFTRIALSHPFSVLGATRLTKKTGFGFGHGGKLWPKFKA
jgi:hypothetical protein